MTCSSSCPIDTPVGGKPKMDGLLEVAALEQGEFQETIGFFLIFVGDLDDLKLPEL